MPIIVDTTAPKSGDFKRLLEEMVSATGSGALHQDTTDAVATIAPDTATTGSTQNLVGASPVKTQTTKGLKKP